MMIKRNDAIHQRRWLVLLVVYVLLSILVARFGYAEVKWMSSSQDDFFIKLPVPSDKGKMSLEETLKKRESVRDFSSNPLTIEALSQLLWAVQGTTRNWGGRTSPSAGALYPLDIYLVLKEGVVHYSPKDHQLVRHMNPDIRRALANKALGQDCIREAPVVFVIAVVYERVARKYGNRADRYVKMEAGHAG